MKIMLSCFITAEEYFILSMLPVPRAGMILNQPERARAHRYIAAASPDAVLFVCMISACMPFIPDEMKRLLSFQPSIEEALARNLSENATD